MFIFVYMQEKADMLEDEKNSVTMDKQLFLILCQVRNFHSACYSVIQST